MSTPPTSKRDRRVDAALALVVLAQLAIPLRYYFGDDPFDERFSWRMFSAVRVIRCQASATDETETGPVEVSPRRVIHPAWAENLERNRPAVVERFLARRCEEPGVERSTLTNRCVDATGAAIEPVVWTRTCASGEVTRTGASR